MGPNTAMPGEGVFIPGTQVSLGKAVGPWAGWSSDYWDEDPSNENGAVYLFALSTGEVLQCKLPVEPQQDGEVTLGTAAVSQAALPSGFVGLPGSWVSTVLQPPDQSGTSRLHAFVPAAKKGSTSPVFLFDLVPGAQMIQIVGGSAPGPCFGATSSATALIIAGTDGTGIWVGVAPWPAQWTTGAMTFSYTSIPVAVGPALSCDPVCIRAAAPGPSAADLCIIVSVDTAEGTSVAEIPATTTASGVDVDGAGAVWTTLQPNYGQGFQNSSQLKVDSLGLVSAFVAQGGSTTPLGFGRSGPGQWGTQEQLGAYYLDYCFVPGVLSATQSGVNGALDDGLVPLWQFWLSGLPDGPVYWVNGQMGQLKRTALAVVPGQKDLLLGIMEGPPPLPLENYQLGGGFGQTMLTDQHQQSTTTNASFGTTMLFQASASEGVSAFGESAKATEEFDMRAGLKAALATVQTTTSTLQYSCVLSPGTADGQAIIKPYGILVTLGPSWTGYSYQVVDMNGDPLPGAAIWTQLMMGPTTCKPLSYVIPPDRPQPGRLGSYPEVLPPEDTSLIGFDDNGTTSNFVPLGWTGAGEVSGNYLSYASQTVTATITFDFKEMVGEEASENILGESASEKVSAGFEISIETSVATQTADMVGLTGTISGLVMDNTVAGTYLDYSTGIFQLAPDPAYAQHLLSTLVAPGFPAEPGDLQMNQDAVVAIATPTSGGASAPWVITYVVLSATKVS